MRRKSRHTTFRTSVGTKVYVEAPEVYVAPGITPEDLEAVWRSGGAGREALREELRFLGKTFQWEHFLEDGVDAHFLCRTVELDGLEKLAVASDYWKRTNTTLEGTFTLPKDKRAVAIYSRRAFKYPQLIAWVKLPNLTLIGNEISMAYHLGIEHGAAFFNGIASFLLRTSATETNVLYATVGTLPPADLKIDVAKPTDFDTAHHVYRVVLTRNLAMFFIDARLRAVAVQCLQGGVVKVKENTLPYSIMFVPPLASSLTSLIEILAAGRTAEAPSDFIIPLSPYRYRVSDGKEIIPLRLPLYLEDSDTEFAGHSISSGSVASHPFPVFGYAGKTIYFRADQNSTTNGLVLEVLTQTGNWRTYDADTYTADSLWVYTVAGEAVLARLSYTPASYPATISEGEVVLR